MRTIRMIEAAAGDWQVEVDNTVVALGLTYDEAQMVVAGLRPRPRAGRGDRVIEVAADHTVTDRSRSI